MPDNDQNQPEPTLEGFVPETPEPETPKEETPPVQEGAEGSKPEDGTPAESNPSEEVTEAAVSEEERLKDQRAYYQTEAQNAKEELKRIQEEHAAESSEEPTSSTPESTTEQATPDRSWLPGMENMSDEEIAERISSDPLLQMQLQDYRTKQTIENILDERDKKTAARERFRAEADATVKHLTAFCEKHEIPTSRVHEIRRELEQAGIKGSPTGIGSIIVDRLNNELMSRGIEAKSVEAAAKAASAVKIQPLTEQPDAGGPATPAQPKTLEEQIAAKYGPSKTAESLRGFFGG